MTEEPDHTQDPRQTERSDQLPEEGPGGQAPDDAPPTDDERHARDAGADDAPDTR